jgi:hypothetical protein
MLTPEQKKTLLEELGQLTYNRAKLEMSLNLIAKRSNEIGGMLERDEMQQRLPQPEIKEETDAAD